MEKKWKGQIRSLGHSPNARAMLEGIHTGIEDSILFRPGIRRMPLVPYLAGRFGATGCAIPLGGAE